ncbi:MAG: hypothetical protein IJA26_01005 [Clostridia bacterium]|nr:hypothetical protein [Clostridia bacterium]
MSVLYLCDPMDAENSRQKMKYTNAEALIFDENERWLPKAQRAFAQGKYFVVGAEGYACAIALALAALLPVETLALGNCRLFDRQAYKGAPTQMKRIAAFARRNLPLVTAHICFSDTDEMEMRRIQSAASPYAQIENGHMEAFLRPD